MKKKKEKRKEGNKIYVRNSLSYQRKEERSITKIESIKLLPRPFTFYDARNSNALSNF